MKIRGYDISYDAKSRKRARIEHVFGARRAVGSCARLAWCGRAPRLACRPGLQHLPPGDAGTVPPRHEGEIPLQLQPK